MMVCYKLVWLLLHAVFVCGRGSIGANEEKMEYRYLISVCVGALGLVSLGLVQLEVYIVCFMVLSL